MACGTGVTFSITRFNGGCPFSRINKEEHNMNGERVNEILKELEAVDGQSLADLRTAILEMIESECET